MSRDRTDPSMIPDPAGDEFAELLETKVLTGAGWPQLECRLNPADLETAAGILAEGVAGRRIGVTPRLHQLWQEQRLEATADPIAGSDLTRSIARLPGPSTMTFRALVC